MGVISRYLPQQTPFQIGSVLPNHFYGHLYGKTPLAAAAAGAADNEEYGRFFQ